jgi:hypothetical protein
VNASIPLFHRRPDVEPAVRRDKPL